MSAPLEAPSWRVMTLAHGTCLTDARGAAFGELRVREGQRPIESAARIFARAAARLPATAADASPVESITTTEGELATFQVLRGELGDDGRFIRCLGAVFGDDAYTLIDGGAVAAPGFASLEAAARALTSHCSLFLGYHRRRRFRYTPPEGWTGSACGLDATWRAPGGRAYLTVHAAQPARSTPGGLFAAVLARLTLAGFAPDPPAPPPRRIARSGLRGFAWHEIGAEGDCPVCLDVVVLEDERFLYPFELCADLEVNAEALAALDRVVRSAQPVPLPEPFPRGELSLHWTL
jgi:hypothetical protein